MSNSPRLAFENRLGIQCCRHDGDCAQTGSQGRENCATTTTTTQGESASSQKTWPQNLSLPNEIVSVAGRTQKCEYDSSEKCAFDDVVDSEGNVDVVQGNSQEHLPAGPASGWVDDPRYH